MTPKDLFRDDVSAIFLNSDEFAESWTYYPTGEPVRTITAAVAEEMTDFPQNANSKLAVRKVNLLVANDVATGITNPRMGDYLERGSDTNPKPKWMFQRIIEQDNAALLLEFTQSRPTRSGHSAGSNL